MTEVVTPFTPITEGQIGKINELLGAKLRKHKNELSTKTMQLILENPEFSDELFQVIRRRAEAFNDVIVRTVKVNRSRSLKQAVIATKRKYFLTDSVLGEIPENNEEEVEVVFFKLGKSITCSELEKEYQFRGLVPDPIAQIAVNESDPDFAIKHSNGTQWRDSKNQWCFVTCYSSGQGENGLSVSKTDRDWGAFWYFAGVRKP